MAYSEAEDKIPQVNEPDLSGTYTAADYLSWKTDELMELIRGKIFKMSPAPSSWHQILFGELHKQMVQTAKLSPPCRIWLAPFDVYLIHPGEDYTSTSNVVQPDLCIICDPSKIKKRGCMGTPDFVVEILSPSTRKKDATLKLELYQEYGVREYWMISISERLIIVNLMDENGHYQTQRPVVEGQTLSPRDFPSIKIDLTELFKDVPDED